MKKFFLVAVLCLVSVAQITGCKAAQVAFPRGNDKAAFEQYDVKGRRAFALFTGWFTFGPYSVDWTRSAVFTKPSESKTMSGAGNSSISTENYTVKLTGAGDRSWACECRARAEYIKKTKGSKKVTTSSTQVISNTLTCSLKSSDKQKVQLALAQDGQGMSLYSMKKGSVKGSGISFDMESTNDLDGSSWGSGRDTGFYIKESGVVIAVVDVTNEGRIYIAKGLGKDKTSVLAAVSAVLLGYRDLAQ